MTVSIRPERIGFGDAGLAAKIVTRVFQGNHWLFQCESECGAMIVIRQNDGQKQPAEGEAVRLAWRPEDMRPAGRHRQKGVQLILNPSASHFAMSKTDLRYKLVLNASRKFNCTYLYTNLLGNEAGRVVYDGEILIAQNGHLLLRNNLLSFKRVDLEGAEVSFARPLPPAAP